MFSSKDSKGFRSYLIMRRNVGIRKKHSSLFIWRINDKEKRFSINDGSAENGEERGTEQKWNGRTFGDCPLLRPRCESIWLEGATTLSITTLRIMTLRITTLRIMTLSITTLSIMTPSIMTLSITALSIMTLSITTLSIKIFL